MARGFKTGGRQKGSKNKRTLLLEERTRAFIREYGRGADRTRWTDCFSFHNCGLWRAAALGRAQQCCASRFYRTTFGFFARRWRRFNGSLLVMIVTLVAFRWASKEPAK